MNKIKIERLKAQIQPKIMKGDYITLGLIMGRPQNTARMRFRRGHKDAVLAMQKIVNNREQFIKENKQNAQID